MKKFLKELCEQGGAVLFSTHVLEVAQKLCDRVVIIQKGKLVQQGRIEEIVGDSDLESVFLDLEKEEQNA